MAYNHFYTLISCLQFRLASLCSKSINICILLLSLLFSLCTAKNRLIIIIARFIHTSYRFIATYHFALLVLKIILNITVNNFYFYLMSSTKNKISILLYKTIIFAFSYLEISSFIFMRIVIFYIDLRCIKFVFRMFKSNTTIMILPMINCINLSLLIILDSKCNENLHDQHISFQSQIRVDKQRLSVGYVTINIHAYRSRILQ